MEPGTEKYYLFTCAKVKNKTIKLLVCVFIRSTTYAALLIELFQSLQRNNSGFDNRSISNVRMAGELASIAQSSPQSQNFSQSKETSVVAIVVITRGTYFIRSKVSRSLELFFRTGIQMIIGLLVGCFGFNSPLGQYFSLYRVGAAVV